MGEEEHRKDKKVTEERKHQENAGKAETERDAEGEKGKILTGEKREREIRREK